MKHYQKIIYFQNIKKPDINVKSECCSEGYRRYHVKIKNVLASPVMNDLDLFLYLKYRHVNHWT